LFPRLVGFLVNVTHFNWYFSTYLYSGKSNKHVHPLFLFNNTVIFKIWLLAFLIIPRVLKDHTYNFKFLGFFVGTILTKCSVEIQTSVSQTRTPSPLHLFYCKLFIKLFFSKIVCMVHSSEFRIQKLVVFEFFSFLY